MSHLIDLDGEELAPCQSVAWDIVRARAAGFYERIAAEEAEPPPRTCSQCLVSLHEGCYRRMERIPGSRNNHDPIPCGCWCRAVVQV